MSNIFNPGARVVFKAGTKYEETGTVIRMGTRDDPHGPEYVYAIWDDSGRQYAHVRNVTLVDEGKNAWTEESAVMFLLSRGYQISKGERNGPHD